MKLNKLNLLKKVKQAGATEILKAGANLIDEVFTNKEEALTLKRDMIKDVLNDRQSARQMYANDSTLQKIFALVFLIGYVIITIVVLYGSYAAIKNDIVFNNESVAFITMIFTAMSTKINTIVDFLFGGSSSQKENFDNYERRPKKE